VSVVPKQTMCMLNVDRMNPYPLDHSLRRLSSLCSDEVQQHGTYPDQKEDRAGALGNAARPPQGLTCGSAIGRRVLDICEPFSDPASWPDALAEAYRDPNFRESRESNL
jgi:hypothetical protein